MIALHSDTAGRARVRTTVGVPVGPPRSLERERDPLEKWPCLAGFDAVDRVRDIAGKEDRAHLMQVDDDELLDAIDRDRELRRRVEL